MRFLRNKRPNLIFMLVIQKRDYNVFLYIETHIYTIATDLKSNFSIYYIRSKIVILSERARSGLYNSCIKISCQALSISIGLSKMCEVFIMENNSFSID